MNIFVLLAGGLVVVACTGTPSPAVVEPKEPRYRAEELAPVAPDETRPRQDGVSATDDEPAAVQSRPNNATISAELESTVADGHPSSEVRGYGELPRDLTPQERLAGLSQYPEYARPTLRWLLKLSEPLPVLGAFRPETFARQVGMQSLEQSVDTAGFELSDVNLPGKLACTQSTVREDDYTQPHPCRDRYLHMLYIFNNSWKPAITNKPGRDVVVKKVGQRLLVNITPGWYNLEFMLERDPPILRRMEYLTDERH